MKNSWWGQSEARREVERLSKGVVTALFGGVADAAQLPGLADRLLGGLKMEGIQENSPAVPSLGFRRGGDTY